MPDVITAGLLEPQTNGWIHVLVCVINGGWDWSVNKGGACWHVDAGYLGPKYRE